MSRSPSPPRKRRCINKEQELDPFVEELCFLIQEVILVDLVPLIVGYYGLSAARYTRSFSVSEQIGHIWGMTGGVGAPLVFAGDRLLATVDPADEGLVQICRKYYEHQLVCVEKDLVYITHCQSMTISGLNAKDGSEFATNHQNEAIHCINADKKEVFVLFKNRNVVYDAATHLPLPGHSINCVRVYDGLTLTLLREFGVGKEKFVPSRTCLTEDGYWILETWNKKQVLCVDRRDGRVLREFALSFPNLDLQKHLINSFLILYQEVFLLDEYGTILVFAAEDGAPLRRWSCCFKSSQLQDMTTNGTSLFVRRKNEINEYRAD